MEIMAQQSCHEHQLASARDRSDVMCPICLYEEDSLNHLFRQCPLTSEAWEIHLGRGIFNEDPHLSFPDWLKYHVLDFREKEGLSSPRLVRFIGLFRQTRATSEGLLH